MVKYWWNPHEKQLTNNGEQNTAEVGPYSSQSTIINVNDIPCVNDRLKNKHKQRII